MMPYGLSSIYNDFMEPFCSPILLWSVWHGHLIFNSILCHISVLLIWQELPSSIKLSAFQCGAKLSFSPCFVLFECSELITFLFEVSHLSRWQYIYIRQWRELAFRPDQNEQDWVVPLPLILKLGKDVSWTFLFHILLRLHEVHWWFGEDHLLCFLRDVLSCVGVCVPFFYAIRYSHWVLLLLPVESRSCVWWVPCWRNEVFLTWADSQYRGCHFGILLYPYLLFGTCYHCFVAINEKSHLFAYGRYNTL